MNIDNKFNLIIFPKCGSTHIIKVLSIYFKTFNSHGHSFNNNTCSKYGLIRTCHQKIMEKKKLNINYKLQTYIILRPINRRLLSFFLSNFTENISFMDFVKGVVSGKINHNCHLDPYYSSDLDKYQNKTIVFLEDLDYFFLKKLNIDCSKEFKSYYYKMLKSNKFTKCYLISKDNLTFPVNINSYFNKEIDIMIYKYYELDFKFINNTEWFSK